jgi:hypothetical protein
MLQKLRRLLPPWFPLVGVDSGRFNVVPVDYVVAAMDHLAHLPGQDGECFHLTNPSTSGSERVRDAAHAPRALRLDKVRRSCPRA